MYHAAVNISTEQSQFLVVLPQHVEARHSACACTCLRLSCELCLTHMLGFWTHLMVTGSPEVHGPALTPALTRCSLFTTWFHLPVTIVFLLLGPVLSNFVTRIFLSPSHFVSCNQTIAFTFLSISKHYLLGIEIICILYYVGNIGLESKTLIERPINSRRHVALG